MTSYLRIESLGRAQSGAAMAILLAVSVDAHAGLIGYQNRAAFNLAIAGWSATSTTFEAEAAGANYGAGAGPAGSGFTLNFTSGSASGLTPTVSDQFWTTSGVNYLGLDNPDSAFEAGDLLSLNFVSGMHAFGLYVIGTRDIGAGDITLAAGAASVANGPVAELQDGSGSFAFFLGLVSNDASTFSSVTLNILTPGDPRLLGVAVDDIVLARDDGGNVNPGTGVPEPGTLVLSVAGMLAFGALARRRAVRSIDNKEKHHAESFVP
jgi:hypothetical protein